MILDTNVIIYHIRHRIAIPADAIIPTVVAGELKSFAIKSGWGIAKKALLDTILKTFPLLDVSLSLTTVYAEIDAYSKGKLPGQPLPVGETSHTMGKNDIWIAAVAMALDEELHTADGDFDHLVPFGLRIKKYNASDPFGTGKPPVSP